MSWCEVWDYLPDWCAVAKLSKFCVLWSNIGGIDGKIIYVVNGRAPNSLELNCFVCLLNLLFYIILYVLLFFADLLLIY